MTIKTLSYIHNLLINAEASAERKAAWARDIYYQKANAFEDGSISKSEYESAKADYEAMRDDHNRAGDALLEFEQKEW